MATDFTASEICAIIETCGKSGVAMFKGCGIELDFVAGRAASPVPLPLAAESEPENQVRIENSPWTTEAERKQAAEELNRQAYLQKQAELAHMMIEDPVGYEKLLTNGELTDESDVEEA